MHGNDGRGEMNWEIFVLVFYIQGREDTQQTGKRSLWGIQEVKH